MGEKAQESTAASAGLPAALVVAGGVLLGGAVAVPTVLVATSDGDGVEAAVAGDETTTTLEDPTTTIIVVTTTTPAPAPPVPATLTPTESATTAGPPSFPIGAPIAGSSVTCAGDRCTVEIVAGRVRVPVEVVLVDDRGSADYTFTIPGAECPGSGVDSVHGTVELQRAGAGFTGTVTLDTDVFEPVEGPTTTCAGSTNTFALTAPA